MKKLFAVILFAIFVSGCATKIYQAEPPLVNPSQYSDVIVIRNNSIFGSGLGIGVQLDGYKIARLGRGDYLRMRVNPGQHAVGTMSGSVTLNFEAEQTYYFLTSIGVSGDQNIERLSEVEGKDRIAKSNEVNRR